MLFFIRNDYKYGINLLLTNYLTMKQIFKTSFVYLIWGLISTVQTTAQCSFTTTVPYFESFNLITTPNQLPICWAASNPGGTCQTYTSPASQNRVPRTGNQFASFSYTPGGVSYFYSNGILFNIT